MQNFKPAPRSVRKAAPVHVPSWSAYHALTLIDPRAARAYFAKHEKQLSPAFKLNKQKP